MKLEMIHVERLSVKSEQVLAHLRALPGEG